MNPHEYLSGTSNFSSFGNFETEEKLTLNFEFNWNFLCGQCCTQKLQLYSFCEYLSSLDWYWSFSFTSDKRKLCKRRVVWKFKNEELSHAYQKTRSNSYKIGDPFHFLQTSFIFHVRVISTQYSRTSFLKY